MSDDAGEKTEEPSQHRIDEARKKGDVAASKELNSVLILAGVLSTLVITSLYIFEVLYEYIDWLYGMEVTKAYSAEMGARIFKESMYVCAKAVLPVFFVSATLGILAQVAQVGILYSPEVLALKFDRINPQQGIKKLFSKKSLGEAAKGVLKFTIVLSISYYVLNQNLNTFLGFLHVEPGAAFSFGKIFALKLALSILAGLLLVAGADFAWEKYMYIEKLRMTKQQVKEEFKEKEGNQEIKQKIRSIQREMSQKRMLSEVPNADVIITNPTHISIIIKYNTMTMVAPQVIGKGQDNMALKIREIAKEHDIPIVENVPLARAIYKTVKDGEGVPRSLYKAVAEILAFVHKVKKKKKALS
jgi:flagellar biosynthetic protein FlhB